MGANLQITYLLVKCIRASNACNTNFRLFIVLRDELLIGASLSEPTLAGVCHGFIRRVCSDCGNDKIRLTSHSSFVMVSYVAYTDCENDKI